MPRELPDLGRNKQEIEWRSKKERKRKRKSQGAEREKRQDMAEEDGTANQRSGADDKKESYVMDIQPADFGVL